MDKNYKKRLELKRSPNIKYINPEVPNVKLPAYEGKKYEALVPDTLDLQEMAALAINGLTEPTDPEADYEIYWRVVFNTNPPMMWHSESDCVQVTFMEALPLLRLVSGSNQNYHVEKRWMEVIKQMQGSDGLLYMTKIGRPWCVFGSYGTEPPGGHYFSPWVEGRLLGAMTIYYLLTGNKEWKDAGQKLVDGLNKLAVHEGNKAHFPCHEFGTDGRYNPPKDPSSAVHNPASYHACCIQGLSNYYKHTGYEPAINLAGKLFKWVKEDSNHFDSDGRFLREYPNVSHMHFHGHTMVLLSVLDYGIASEDKEAIDFAHRGFKYAITQGECLLGYFAEWLNVVFPSTLELCELADMLGIAVKLSKAGIGDYWDMVDRWTRNLFFEGQLRRSEWVYWMADKIATTEIAPMKIPPYHTTERVIERNIGAFGGWLSPNDFIPDKYPQNINYRSPGIMHCCTGNATRAIYYIWENIITYNNDQLRINLLLNRTSQWVDVDSHIPYTGQVDVKIKKSVNLFIRIPEWVKPENVRCAINSKEHKIKSNGRYAVIGKVKEKDLITLYFPINERSEVINVEKRIYRILLRGNTCVAIDPPGVNFPLFQRDYYRENQTRWRNTTRFISDKQIDW